jgi:hypothetical protein
VAADRERTPGTKWEHTGEQIRGKNWYGWIGFPIQVRVLRSLIWGFFIRAKISGIDGFYLVVGLG